MGLLHTQWFYILMFSFNFYSECTFKLICCITYIVVVFMNCTMFIMATTEIDY